MVFTENQRQAIETIEENLKIVACAGSGKTRTVTERIVQLLKTGKAEPKNIVAFTFTEKAAAELKSRINARVKEAMGEVLGMAEMYVGTIHSFCLNILQDHYAEYQKFNVLDEIKTKLFIQKYWQKIGAGDLTGEVNGNEKKLSRKDTSLYMSIINLLRENLIEKKTLPNHLNEALRRYNECFIDAKYFDFTMIMQTLVEALEKDASLSDTLKGRIRYLTVDEYQDVNPIQEKLIRHLSELGANLCVVGDDDQTIYEWRGSDIENIITFEKRYKNTCKIDLDENFRSTKGIIDIATRVVANNKKREDKNMKASSGLLYHSSDVFEQEFEKAEDEFAFIANQIVALYKSGYHYSDMVILTRVKKHTPYIVTELEKQRIPFLVEDVNELFATPEVKAARSIFDYLNGIIEKEELEKIWRDVHKSIGNEQIKRGMSVLDDYLPIDNKKIYFSFILQKIYQDFLAEMEITEPVGEVDKEKEILLYNLGKFSQVIDDFESIYYTFRPLDKLSNFINFLDYTAEGAYSEGHLQNIYLRPDAVRIMTIHQSKGLEFPIVFLPLLSKGQFPQGGRGGLKEWHFIDRKLIPRQERFEPVDQEAERRLFYVAITRAKKFLFLSRSDYYRTNNGDYTKNASKMSLFMQEAKKSRYVIRFNENHEAFHYDGAISSVNNEPPEILLNFSVLSDYYACPYRYKMTMFYGFVQPIFQQIGYGRSLHNIIMKIHRQYEMGKPEKREDLSNIINQHFFLRYLSEESQIYKDMRKKAQKAMETYYDSESGSFDKIVFAEKEIEISMGKNIRVNGRIDLVKRFDMDGPRTFIIDFKTADRDYYQTVEPDQLRIYALGYQKLTGEKADFLEFYNLESDDRDRHALTDTELKETEQRIIMAAGDIRGNVLYKQCSEKNCGACYMAHLCLDKKDKIKYKVKSRK